MEKVGSPFAFLCIFRLPACMFARLCVARVSDFSHTSFEHIPREKNAEADKLANQAMDEGETEQGGLF